MTSFVPPGSLVQLVSTRVCVRIMGHVIPSVAVVAVSLGSTVKAANSTVQREHMVYTVERHAAVKMVLSVTQSMGSVNVNQVTRERIVNTCAQEVIMDFCVRRSVSVAPPTVIM